METQKRIIGLIAVGAMALSSLVGTIERAVFKGNVGEENITLTEKVNMSFWDLTKMPYLEQTLTVSNPTDGTYVFSGRRDGEVLRVEHMGTNGITESYGKYSDKIKSYQSAFANYQEKINHEMKVQK